MGQGTNSMQNNEQMAAEQVTVAEMGPAPAMSEESKKKSNGMLIGLILCLLIAIGGVGFGVWMMMDSNAQKDSLNKQISDLRKQNNDLLEQLDDGDTIINIDTDTDVDTADYIYVGEWGVKIKIPENLKRVSYTKIDGGSIVVWGNIDERLPGFADPYKNDGGLGAVARTSEECGMGTVLAFSDDGYNYCYAHPQSVYSVGDEEVGAEVETIQRIQDMLRDADNYSAI